MSRRCLPGLVSVLVVLSIASCGGGGGEGPAADAGPDGAPGLAAPDAGPDAPVEPTAPDAAADRTAPGLDVAPDVASDVERPDARDAGPRADACVPGCHYDCFGGLVCEGGKVYEMAYAPRPCCRFGDFADEGGLVCVPKPATPAYACAKGCGSPLVDRRYDACLRRRTGGPPLPATLLRLACREGAPRNVGDPCAGDEDCRPAAEEVTEALRCDPATSRCAAATRPAPPPSYAAACAPSAGPFAGGWGVSPSPTCALCLSRADIACGGAAGACVTACAYDEDCPAGSVCICAPGAGQLVPGTADVRVPTQICVPRMALLPLVTGRALDGWPACPGRDAGADR